MAELELPQDYEDLLREFVEGEVEFVADVEALESGATSGGD